MWSVDSQENPLKSYHQMLHFKAEMHQIRFRLGRSPRPRWVTHSAPPDPLAGLRGSYF